MADRIRDTWSIDESRDGWKLTVQPRLSWRWLLPRTGTEWLGIAGCFYFAYQMFPGFLLTRNAPILDSLFLTAVIFACILGFYAASLWFIYMPLGFQKAFQAHKRIEVTFHPASFECEEGVFQYGCLSTLRLVPIKRLDRFRIVFTGTALKEAPLVDWPGLPEDTAREVMQAVAARSGVAAREG